MVRFGLIGCGRIAQKHVQTLSTIQEATLTAVSDIQPQRMQEIAQQYVELVGKRQGSAQQSRVSYRQYSQYEDLLLDPTVDVVIVCALSSLHGQIAQQALPAGKHVLIEKPISLSLQEADAIIELADKMNKHVLICHQLRYRPLFQKIKQVLNEQAMGSMYLGVTSVRIHRPAHYYTNTKWRGTWAKDGGMLVNQGIHYVDLLQWFLGDVHEVYGEISHRDLPKETEDVALGLLTFQNKSKGIIEANTLTFPTNMGYSLSLFGEKGAISIDGLKMDNVTRWSLEKQSETITEIKQLAQDHNEHVYMYNDLIQVVTGKKERVLVDAREGKRALETIYSLYRSTLVHRPQRLPLRCFHPKNMKRDDR